VSLEESAGEAVAERFLVSAESSFAALLMHPYMGVRIQSRRNELVGVRRWQVKEFENHLIFYLPRPDGIAIVRVLHSNQNWWRALGVMK
jgi:toxin ParE1/3/4